MKIKDVFLIGLVALLLCVLCPLLPAASFAQGTITYIENFNDNSNGWRIETGNDRDSTVEIRNGKYLLSLNKKNISGRYEWLSTPVIEDNDFQIEVTVRFVRVAENSEFGVIWGGDRKGYQYYMFSISGKGSYMCLKSVATDKTKPLLRQDIAIINWTDSPSINKDDSLNKIRVRKTGNSLELSVNDRLMSRVPFETPFGRDIGLKVLRTLSAVEVEDLRVTTTNVNIPTGWTVLNEGNFKSRFTWPPEAEKLLSITAVPPPQFKAEIYNGGHITLNKSFSGDNIMAGTTVKAPVNAQGSAIGVYIQTEDGGMLKMERVDTPKGIVARFSAAAGGKEIGSKEVAIPAGEANLKITRQKGSFKG